MRIVSLFIVALCAQTPGAGLACGNEVHLTKRQEVRGIVRAEKLLQKRMYPHAMKSLFTLYRYGLRSARAHGASRDEALFARARRVAALVAVRTQGKISLDAWNGKVKSPKGIARQLKWARDVLAKAHTAKPDDPAVAGHYAEALALTGAEDDALKRLEGLAKADLITDAETWKALADLRSKQGDTAGRDAATTRCEASAADKAICRPTS